MRINICSVFVAAATLCAATTPARADVRVRWRDTSAQPYEETLYLKGSSQRREGKSTQRDGSVMRWAFINDCASQKFIWLDLVNGRYSMYTGGVPFAVIAAFNEQQFPAPTPPGAKGTLVETTTVTDTGERREMFGFNARRLKTLMTWRIEPDACPVSAARAETDGWYVDLLYGVDCSPDLSGAIPRSFVDLGGSTCLSKRFNTRKYFFRRQYEGQARLGFPLVETTRTYDERGGVREQTRETLELSTDALPDALFAVPAGYARYEPRPEGKPNALTRALSIFRRGK
ncbi:MAG TPA: hypothetical protein VM864_07140 [Pyrinomonadaceae bacterium]|jgi:hypothetical protein|nr:hypothetical protein [Pyrinomonadaceae bacterium]